MALGPANEPFYPNQPTPGKMSLSGDEGPSGIVAAVDDSKESLKVCRVAGWLAAVTNADLTLLEVIPSGGLSTVFHGEGFKERLEEEAKKRLESAAEPIRKDGVAVTTTSLEATESVVNSIVNYAAANGAGLLVLGTRSHGGLQKMLSGSVSSGVATHAGCSVVVVRGGSKGVFKRILVAVDGSENSAKAVRAASKLAKVAGAELTVIHIVHLPSYVYSYGTGRTIERIESDQKKYGEELLAKAARITREAGIGVKEELIEDLRSPALRIEKYAEAQGMDLLVMGARGVGAFERLMLGSVALGVLNNSKRSVMVVR